MVIFLDYLPRRKITNNHWHVICYRAIKFNPPVSSFNASLKIILENKCKSGDNTHPRLHAPSFNSSFISIASDVYLPNITTTTSFQ